MPNWKTYKGEGPWDFAKSQAEAKYNQGDAIRNAGQPVWDINATKVGVGGTPITDIHYPNCGMWNGLEAPGDPPPPPFTPVTIPLPVLLKYVAWTPNYGTPGYGRFIGTDYSKPYRIHYSDDGGINWSYTDVPEFVAYGVSWDIIGLDFCNNRFMASCYVNTLGPAGGFAGISLDGINWVLSSSYERGPFVRQGSSFIWNDSLSMYFVSTYQGGNTSDVFSSPDGMVWTYVGYPAVFQTNYLSLLDGSPYTYIFCSNYSFAYKFNLDLPITFSLLAGGETPIPFVGADRRQAISDGSKIVYDGCYFNGSIWIDNNNPVSRIDCNRDSISGNSLFACTSFQISPDRRKILGLSRDGITWTDHTIGISTQLFDVAVGYERVVCSAWGLATFAFTIS